MLVRVTQLNEIYFMWDNRKNVPRAQMHPRKSPTHENENSLRREESPTTRFSIQEQLPSEMFPRGSVWKVHTGHCNCGPPKSAYV